MPRVEVAVEGFKISWLSVDDFLRFCSQNIVPVGQTYGYRVTIEPIPPTETMVDRV